MWTQATDKLRDSRIYNAQTANTDQAGRFIPLESMESVRTAEMAKSTESKEQVPTILINGDVKHDKSAWIESAMEEMSPQEDVVEPKMTFRRFMVLTAMGFLWTGSQIPLYLFGGIISLITTDIGGSDRYVWIALGNLIPLAVITPFVGALSDIFGRKALAMFASVLLITGNAVCGTARTMNIFIGGQVLIGTGAGIAELTALAVAGEIAPTKKRGLYVGGMIITIFPYCPAVLYAVAVARAASWRYIGLWCGLWSLVGLLLTAAFYFPPPKDLNGVSRMTLAKRIDYVGGVLSAGGLTLFLAGLTWAGNQYAWTSPHVLINLILGGLLCIAFAVWEIWFAKYPMFPARLKQNPRVLTVILITTFVSGANFFAVLVFWPSQYYFMYATDDIVSIGVGSLPVGFGIIGGSIIVSVLITVFKGKIRWLLVGACVVMTAGNGAMACARLDNLNVLYIPVTLACIGVGAVIVPNQIICSIVCPADLIATVTALTISVRVIGGAIAYAIYYNVLRHAFVKNAYIYIVRAALLNGIVDISEIRHIAELIAANLKEEVAKQPGVTSQKILDALLYAGKQTFAASFPIVYYVSIAFGAVAIISCFFLKDIGKHMTGDVAVLLH